MGGIPYFQGEECRQDRQTSNWALLENAHLRQVCVIPEAERIDDHGALASASSALGFRVFPVLVGILFHVYLGKGKRLR